jgi:hypothetical protein
VGVVARLVYLGLGRKMSCYARVVMGCVGIMAFWLELAGGDGEWATCGSGELAVVGVAVSAAEECWGEMAAATWCADDLAAAEGERGRVAGATAI